MTKTMKLKTIKKLNLLTIVIDLIVPVLYTIFFSFLFGSIKTPSDNLGFVDPDSLLDAAYVVMGRVYSAQEINLLIGIFAIFMLVGYTMFIVNLKHNLKLEVYDYHRWEAGNTVVKGVMGILTLNFVSLALRIFIAHLILDYAEDESIISIFKKLKAERKEKKEREAKFEHTDQTPEELEIKKRVRRQTFFKVLRYFFTYLVLLFFALFILIPFYWMILTALKTYDQSRAQNPSFWLAFKDLQWVNIRYVIEELKFGQYIRNTLIVAVASTIGTVITTILAAFAFSRIDFKGRDAIFSVLLMTMMIPGEIYMITNFLTVSRHGFGWVGTGVDNPIGYFATLIFPNMISVFYIFFLRQSFKQIPDTLYKAAKVDGCSDFKFLRRVMIPIAAPTIFTITILNILGAWSAFIWPRLITSVEPFGRKYWLISVALREESFVLESGADPLPMFNLQIAATAIVTVPLIIVFLLLRKYIMSGVGRSGTKG
ncbi:MAG: carbohydrate ABC transporter permease [Acholeplasmataceae bacterium]|jgi:ABC-type glycerol-3-phosphate transport system permease component|nr:carbohydrate ABC transporter permease [Acholeplasmataceae bacterium]